MRLLWVVSEYVRLPLAPVAIVLLAMASRTRNDGASLNKARCANCSSVVIHLTDGTWVHDVFDLVPQCSEPAPRETQEVAR